VHQLQNRETTNYGWHDLVAAGLIEYVDTEEEETTMISMTVGDLEAARVNLQTGGTYYTTYALRLPPTHTRTAPG
jgi:DNA-directed RNA polymerase beta subunit